MKKIIKIVSVFALIITIIGFFLLFRSIDESILEVLSKQFNILVKSYWVARLQKIGFYCTIFGIIFSLIGYLVFINLLFIKTKFVLIIQKVNIWIKIILERIIRLDTKNPIVRKRNKALINYFDLVIAIGFILISLLYFFNPCQGNYHYIELSGDAATITSIAAAYDHPELFKGDLLYGDNNLYKFYSTIHIPLIRFIEKFTNNYSLSYMLLIIPHIFFQLLGFYLLGRILFNNRFWALFLALITFIPISLDQELWGIWIPYARILFQTFLPYLWSLAFIWRNKPDKWIWLMIFSGLLVYVHPFSGLIWGFCIWLGFLFFIPKNKTILQKMSILLGLGLIFIIIIVPYTYIFLPSHQIGVSQEYEFIIHILKTFFPPNIFDVPAVILGFIKITLMNGVLPIGFLSIIILFYIKNKERSDINLTIIWIFGILLVSIAIPFFERLIERIFRLIPIEVVLTRGLRYVYPLLLLFFVWALNEIFQRARNRTISSVVIAIGILFLCIYGISQRDYFLFAWQKLDYLFFQGKPVCPLNEVKDKAIYLINKSTPPGSKILAYTWKGIETTEFYEIRYAALRPLVFNFKDSGFLWYSNYEKLKVWYDIYWSLVKIHENFPEPCERLSKLIDLQKKLQADYLFVDSNGNNIRSCNVEAKTIFNLNNYFLFQ